MKEIQKAMALAMVLALTAVVVLGAVGADEVDAADPTIPSVTHNVDQASDLVNDDGTFKLTGDGGRIVLHNDIELKKTLNITSGKYEITSVDGKTCRIINNDPTGNVTDGLSNPNRNSVDDLGDGNTRVLINVTGLNTYVKFTNVIVDGKNGATEDTISKYTEASPKDSTILLFVTGGASVILDSGTTLTNGGAGVWLMDLKDNKAESEYSELTIRDGVTITLNTGNEIRGKPLTSTTGGVGVNGNATKFLMTGGTIEWNVSKFAGGINFWGNTNGIAEVSGGTIRNNYYTNTTENGGGGGILIDEKGKATLSSGNITENEVGVHFWMGMGSLTIGGDNTGQPLFIDGNAKDLYLGSSKTFIATGTLPAGSYIGITTEASPQSSDVKVATGDGSKIYQFLHSDQSDQAGNEGYRFVYCNGSGDSPVSGNHTPHEAGSVYLTNSSQPEPDYNIIVTFEDGSNGRFQTLNDALAACASHDGVETIELVGDISGDATISTPVQIKGNNHTISGTLTVTSDNVSISDASVNSINVNSGKLTVPSGTIVNGSISVNSGTLEVNGTVAGDVTTSDTVDVNGTISGKLTVNDGTTTASGVISGGMAVSGGTVNLSGTIGTNNSTTGLDITGGTVKMSGGTVNGQTAISLNHPGQLTLANGTGVISGSSQNRDIALGSGVIINYAGGNYTGGGSGDKVNIVPIGLSETNDVKLVQSSSDVSGMFSVTGGNVAYETGTDSNYNLPVDISGKIFGNFNQHQNTLNTLWATNNIGAVALVGNSNSGGVTYIRGYTTLQATITAATDDQVVHLLTNLTETVTVDKTMTVSSYPGKSWTISGGITVSGGKLTLTNVTITKGSGNTHISATNSSTIIFDSGSIVQNIDNGDQYVIGGTDNVGNYVMEDGSTLSNLSSQYGPLTAFMSMHT